MVLSERTKIYAILVATIIVVLGVAILFLALWDMTKDDQEELEEFASEWKVFDSNNEDHSKSQNTDSSPPSIEKQQSEDIKQDTEQTESIELDENDEESAENNSDIQDSTDDSDESISETSNENQTNVTDDDKKKRILQPRQVQNVPAPARQQRTSQPSTQRNPQDDIRRQHQPRRQTPIPNRRLPSENEGDSNPLVYLESHVTEDDSVEKQNDIQPQTSIPTVNPPTGDVLTASRRISQAPTANSTNIKNIFNVDNQTTELDHEISNTKQEVQSARNIYGNRNLPPAQYSEITYEVVIGPFSRIGDRDRTVNFLLAQGVATTISGYTDNWELTTAQPLTLGRAQEIQKMLGDNFLKTHVKAKGQVHNRAQQYSHEISEEIRDAHSPTN